MAKISKIEQRKIALAKQQNVPYSYIKHDGGFVFTVLHTRKRKFYIVLTVKEESEKPKCLDLFYRVKVLNNVFLITETQPY